MELAAAELTGLLSALTYWMDDAEEFPPELEPSVLAEKITQIREKLDTLSKHYDNGRMIREGIRTVLLGMPNAGKSSIMNLLCGTRRSIVTDIPGTTRDIVREQVKINEFTLIISDTAGIRETGDEIEKIGVADALHEADQADFIIYVIDSTNCVSDYDKELLSNLEGKRVIVLWNKTDRSDSVPPVLDYPVIATNAFDEETIDKLYAGMREMFADASFLNQPCVMNERQFALIMQAIQSLDQASERLQMHSPLDMLAFDLETALRSLHEIDGTDVSEDVIQQVFSKFCVGK